MALIECVECGHKVSDRAPSCINCGYPIAGEVEVQAIGTTVTTVQETSKSIKGHIVLAVCLIIGGCTFSMLSAGSASSSGTSIGVLMMLAGFIWYLVTRVRGWWHHG